MQVPQPFPQRPLLKPYPFLRASAGYTRLARVPVPLSRRKYGQSPVIPAETGSLAGLLTGALHVRRTRFCAGLKGRCRAAPAYLFLRRTHFCVPTLAPWCAAKRTRFCVPPAGLFRVMRTRFCADLWCCSDGTFTKFPFYMRVAEKASTHTQRIRGKLAALRAVPVSAQTDHGCQSSAG